MATEQYGKKTAGTNYITQIIAWLIIKKLARLLVLKIRNTRKTHNEGTLTTGSP